MRKPVRVLHRWGAAAKFAWDGLLPLHRAARRHGRDLRLLQDHTANIPRDGFLLFSTLRNEAFRIPYFLQYYRTLGVDHFLLIDNGSDDGFLDLVRDMPDVSVWFTTASYRQSEFGIHWLNHLLARYGVGRWCLIVDPDEFLVFPHVGDRDLHELTAHLNAERLLTLPCVLVDMYGPSGPDDATYEPGQPPLDACPWFDALGYRFQNDPTYGGFFVQGGVRERLFFAEAPEKAPALNKIPLVKWQRAFACMSSTHTMLPRRLNTWHGGPAPRLTGALLHFKFLAPFRQKVQEELVRGQHYDESFEYKRYFLTEEQQRWICPRSRRYRSWRDLCESGLMTVGQWF